jgi:uncharacterized protein YdgA (DUF945 family)
MKKLAILLIILIVALFVTPGIIGFKVQSRHQEVVARMQQGGLEVVSDNYRRGWFGSSAEVKFKLAMPSGVKGAPAEFTMLNEIVHGPLSPDGGLALAAMDTSFKVDDKALFPGDENRVLRTNVGFDGNGKTLIAIPALKLADKPGRPEIQFSGADGSVQFDTSLSQLEVDLKMPELWVAGEKGETLKLSEVEIKSDSKSGLFSLFLGNGKFKIKQIEFNNPKKEVALKIDAIDISNDTRESDGKLTIGINYSVDAVAVNNVIYGPAKFEMEFDNISAEVTAKLQKEMQEMRALNLTKEQESMAMLNLLMGVGPDLLQANPKMAVKRLFVKTPDGDIDGTLSVASDGLQWKDIGDFRTVLQKLEADAAISMPEKVFKAIVEMQAKAALMRQIEQRKQLGHEIAAPSKEEMDNLSQEMASQQLEFLLQQEFVKQDGAIISTQAKLGDGLLSVNGKTIPLQ